MLGLATRGAPRAAVLLSLLLWACPPSEPDRDAGLDASSDAAASDADAPRSDAWSLDAAVIDAPPDAPRLDAPAAPDACPSPTRLCGSACVDTTADPDHCGRCDSPCVPLAGSIPFCAVSRCVNAVCRPGFGNCDMNRTNGCEIDVDSSVDHCGRCDHRCEGAPNAQPVCELGTCILVCDPGWTDCDASMPGCECAA